MSAREVAPATRPAKLLRHPSHSLLVKFLLLLGPIFLGTALPGIWFLIDYQLRDSQELLAARLGNHAARTAAALERQVSDLNSPAAQDLLGMLAVDRAFLCAELIDWDTGEVLLAQPPKLGCKNRKDGQALTLTVSDNPHTILRLRYTDAEYQEAEALQRGVSMSVVGLAFVLALAAATLGFRLIVNRPLGLLLTSIRQSAVKGERRTIASRGNDEIQTVIHEFNTMILRDAEREDALRQANASLRETEASLKKLNDELDQRVRTRTAELEREKFRAEEASHAKSRFLASMSHELRTPLNAIIGFSSVMQQEAFGKLGNPRYVGYAADILESGENLLRLVNNVLDMANIQSGTASLKETTIDIYSLFTSSIALVQAAADRKGIVVRYDGTNPRIRVRGDVAKLEQVLVNLLSNGVKFTPEGGKVQLASSVEPGGPVVLTIADTGIGMREEEIPVALSTFSQVDDSLSRSYEGAGLGLPLAKCLTELHGGTLEVDSAPGRGTRVTVRLPRDRVIAHGTAAA